MFQFRIGKKLGKDMPLRMETSFLVKDEVIVNPSMASFDFDAPQLDEEYITQVRTLFLSTNPP